MKKYVSLIIILMIVLSCKDLFNEKPAKTPETEQETEQLDTIVPETDSDTLKIQLAERKPDTTYTYVGRTAFLAGEGRELISPGAYVRFAAMGDRVKLHLKTSRDEHASVVVTLDETTSWRYQLKKTGVSLIDIPLDNRLETVHEIAVYKATEASTGGVEFLKAEANKVFHTRISKDLKFEFIGNSITCGYGADTSLVPCGKGDWWDQSNAFGSYASQLSRKMGADFMLSAVSGMGMYRNWNDEGTAVVMPDVYETLYLDGNRQQLRDFNEFVPDIISICIGTNDLSKGDGKKERKPFDKEKFINAYTGFLSGLIEKNPTSSFALLTSPMLSGKDADILFDCLKKVKANFSLNPQIIEIYKFAPMKTTGCAGHPNLDEQHQMSEDLRPFYISILDKRIGEVEEDDEV